MITIINGSKMLNEHVWCYFKCNFDDRKFNSNQNLNKELSSCECKNLIKHYTCEKKVIWDSSTCAYEIDQHVTKL